MGISFVPNLYKVMASNPAYLEANWQTVLRAIVAGLLAGAVMVARWTWIRLWRVGSTQREHVIYDRGVRTAGPAIYVVLVGALGWQQSVWDRLLRGTPNGWMQLVILLVVSAPIALWAGLAWGFMWGQSRASR